ncbi:MAG: YjgN family protein [Burkholderiaceae bacterium]
MNANTPYPQNPSIEAFSLEFSGRGGEFFRVWLVNLLLTIVTLGLYTPLARRRTAQYFFSHTQVAGSPLEFTAEKRKMLMGFLLLVVLYIAFKLAADTGQDVAVSLFLLGGALLAPYFWGSAMRFRLASTRWRGVRLQFTARWGTVYKASWPVFVFALVWIAFAFLALADAPASAVDLAAKNPRPALPTLTTWGPVLLLLALVASMLCIIRLEFNYKSLMVAKARIGSQLGHWKPVYGDFVRIWLATLGVFLACVLLVGLLLGALVGGSAGLLAGDGGFGLVKLLLILGLVVAFVFVLLFASAPARAYREARMFQLVWNNVGVSQIARFRCALGTRAYVLLRVKNLLLTLLTLGFYRPFAMVSEYRMKAESVTLHVKGGLDQLVGQLVRQQDALGDAVADVLGLDFVG